MKNERLGTVTSIWMAGVILALASSSAMARTLYWAGGSVDIADGTPLPTTVGSFSGTWDKTTKNWAVDADGSAYVAWEDGEDAIAWLPPFKEGDSTAILTLTDDVALNQIVVPHTAPATGYSHAYALTAASVRTLALTGTDPALWVSNSEITRQLHLGANIHLAASNGFAKTGSGYVQLYSQSPDVLGTVVVNGYNGLYINNNAALLGVSELDLRGRLRVYMSSGANDRIGDGAIVRLRGGAFQPYGVADATESFGRIALTASGVLDLSVGSGTPRGRFIAADATQGIGRGPDGTGVLHFQGNGSDNFQTDVVIPNGIPVGILLPWAATLQSRPVQLNSGTQAFEPLAVTPAPADLSTWVPGSRYRIEGSYTPGGTLGTVSVESLGIYNSNGAFTLPIGADDTLTLASGQLSMNPGSTDGSKTLSGGLLTSGTNALYLLTGNSGANQHLFIQSAITGAIDVIKGGASHVYFTGSAINTYTGTTHVNWGRLWLYRTSDQGSIPGDLMINYGGEVFVDGGSVYTINTNANLTIRAGGALTHNNSTAQRYSGTVTFEGGTMSLGGYGSGATFDRAGTGLVFADGGTIRQTYSGASTPMNLLTDVRYEVAATNQAMITTVNATAQGLSLTTAGTGPATRTFDVADAVGLDPATPELTLDIPLVTAAGMPATLVKTGTGVLALERLCGNFDGGATVQAGTLLVNGPYAMQSVLTVTAGGAYATTVQVSPSTQGLYVSQPVTGGGIRSGTRILSITSATTVTLSKWGWATAGVRECVFPATGALGTSSVAVSSSGTLGGTGGVAGTVTLQAGANLAPGTPATPVGAFSIGGTLDLSAGGTLRIDIESETTHDRVSVAGDVLLGGSVEPTLSEGFNPAAGEWVIATYTGTASEYLDAPSGYKVALDVGTRSILLQKQPTGMVVIVR